MATPMTYDELKRVLVAEGLTVVEIAGSRSRCRCHAGSHADGGPTIRAWGPVHGTMVHITAGALGGQSAEQYIASIIDGDPALPDKAHFVVGPDGTVYLNSAGRSNHAGVCGARGIQKVIDDSLSLSGYEDLRGHEDDGNTYLYGIENIAAEQMNEVQRVTSVKICAAIARHYGWTGQGTPGHGELSDQRSYDDPGLNMGAFRRDVMAAVGKVSPPANRWVDLGQKLLDGNEARGCEHMAEWLPLFNKMGVKRGLIHESFDIVQAQGGAVASAGTHLDGTALDFRVNGYDTKWVVEVAHLARECGMPATWPRGDAGGTHWDNAFAGNNHIHGVLDCPCSSHARYQITAVKDGFNGLGEGGRAAADPIAKPDVWRTWSEGVSHMKAELGIVASTPAPSHTTTATPVAAPIVKEAEMALSDEDIERIRRAILYTPFDHSKLTVGGVLERVWWTLPGVVAYLQKIAKKLGA